MVRRDAVAKWLEAVDLVLLQRPVLSRASEPFPVPLGTLGALHLATALLGGASRKGPCHGDPRRPPRARGGVVRHRDHAAIEVKAKDNVAPRERRALHALAEERPIKHALCVSLDPRPRHVGAVRILPCGDFLDALWAGELA